MPPMYETSEWSDLEIASSDGSVFKVDTSVVCLASPFFRAACDKVWREERSGVIELPENAVILDAMLRHCYGIIEAGDHQWNDHIDHCAFKGLEIVIAANKV
ncbi:hypothetical protein HII31_12910 [Pseudocercospora fuligena]|uniref:BTB domain-containing protein n=1 Tax=Pseudocercospora fuligena TaxID=685502 RepID=A0A8H6R771_9PEZI|nr:hypothetical protein HII31_12910 [Pseudocercospora fuligena]